MAINDPDELDDVDQKIRINEKKEKLKEITGKEMSFQKDPDCPPEVEEAFLDSITAYETAAMTTNFDQLARAGFKFPPAAELTDVQLSAKLAEVIQRLAELHVFLYHTNHLSDRELYQWLREEGLREEVPDVPVDPQGCWHLDVLGACGTEEIDLHLRYYATEEERAEHCKDYPDWPLPPHEDPKYDRDRGLPDGDEFMRRAAQAHEEADADDEPFDPDDLDEDPNAPQ